MLIYLQGGCLGVEICDLDLCLGKKKIFFYDVFVYYVLFFGKVRQYYICVVLYDAWEFIGK